MAIRRRANRRRGNTRRGRNNGRRRTMSIFKRRLQNVRNKPNLRPRSSGFSTINLNTIRRLISYPSSGAKPSPDAKAPASAWWLDKLQWFASVALKLVGLFLAGDDSNGANFVVTGCGTVLSLSPADFLVNSPLSVISPSGGPYRAVPFEQARFQFIRIHLSPSPDMSLRGGFYVAALVPIEPRSSEISNLQPLFDILCLQPGSVMRPVTQPISVSWSPTVAEAGIAWRDVETDESEANGNPAVVLCIAFSDLATDRAPGAGETSLEYKPSKAGLEIHMEAGVQVRNPGYSTITSKLYYTDPTKIFVRDHLGLSVDIPLSDVVTDSHGVCSVPGLTKTMLAAQYSGGGASPL